MVAIPHFRANGCVLKMYLTGSEGMIELNLEEKREIEKKKKVVWGYQVQLVA